MKQRLSIAIILLIYVGQSIAASFSPATRHLMSMARSGFHKQAQTVSESLAESFPVSVDDGKLCISAFVKVEASFDLSRLQTLDGAFRIVNDSLLMTRCPVDELAVLGAQPGVLYIEVDTPVRYRLDAARELMQADKAHAGTGFSAACTGEGVVVGIIDSGFDYTHPAFENASGQCRILRVWDQRDLSGTPPVINGQAPLTPGSEYQGKAILNKRCDSADGDGMRGIHGTSVAGAAAGYGADANGMYGGIAPDANLVLITFNGGAVAIAEAMEYIFETAQNQGMPAVINLSKGSHYGPHDGTSVLDQTIDRLSGSGKIVVGAAGNEGDKGLHLSHDFHGETIRTAPEPDGTDMVVELWGPASGSFEVSVGAVNPATYAVAEETDYFSTRNNPYEEGVLYGGTVYSVYGIQANSDNQKPNMQVWVRDIGSYPVCLQIRSDDGIVHLWNVLETGINDFGRPDFKSGDSAVSIGEIGGTARSIISVGSYNSKLFYTDINNTQWQMPGSQALYDIAASSSRGPTADGRIKPDITAPGRVLVMPYSSYTNISLPNGIEVALAQGFFPYGAFDGTSFSAPLVTGTVALLLQQDPDLTPEQIKTLLNRSAQTDGFTGQVPNNIWGAGKADTYGALNALTHVEMPGETQPQTFVMHASYPNPFNPVTTLSYTLPQSSTVLVVVYNERGQHVETLIDERQNAGYHHLQWHAEGLPSGLYFCKIQTADIQATQKMMLLR